VVQTESGHTEKLSRIEAALGYNFKQINLLVTAMTHSSYAHEAPDTLKDNERLEFLGDAVLDLVVSEYLMEAFPEQDEGVLTQTRADLVAMPSLAGLARSLEIGDGLLLGRGEERSGGRNKPNLLADALEAAFGAVFVDGGYVAAKQVIQPLVVTLLQRGLNEEGQDYKTRLQEVLQAQHKPLPVYRLVDSLGPDHERIYHVEVLLAGESAGAGDGRSKKNAEQLAAKSALQKLGLIP
jgi:ribonuclease-3